MVFLVIQTGQPDEDDDDDVSLSDTSHCRCVAWPQLKTRTQRVEKVLVRGQLHIQQSKLLGA